MADQEAIERLLGPAEMITAGEGMDAAVELVGSAVLAQPAANVASARLVASAHGAYEARIDGVPVDDSVLSPGWTAFEYRVQVKDVDVTALVQAAAGGALELCVLLGNGWYRGQLGFNAQNFVYGEELGFIAALEVVYADGAVQVVRTGAGDGSGWSARVSQVTCNTLYHGETIDARIVPAEHPLPVRAVDFDRATLVPQEGPDIRRMGSLRPLRIWRSPAGKLLVDFGQNISGWLRFSVQGPAGAEIVIRHAEVLEHEELGTRPLREAKATDRFILSGGEDCFEPTLTFHGFRYAEVTGWPGELTAADLEAVAVYSDIRQTGWFSCSNADVNQLVQNSLWGNRDNFVDVPTDCPQRDERLGWTGDLAVYVPTATFQHDCSSFLHKWLMDLAAEAEHDPSGNIPVIAPNILKKPGKYSIQQTTAIWGDAAIWVPWQLWLAYGDADALRAHYPLMVRQLTGIEDALSPEGLWNTGFQFGDWLDPAAPPSQPGAGRTNGYLVAQACFYRDAVTLAEAAAVLDLPEDEAHWRELAELARAGFRSEYRDEQGALTSDHATAYALAIHFGLLDEDEKPAAAAHLAELVRGADWCVDTGFAGTPYVTWALSENGYADDAYRMLQQTKCPSWLYAVSMGATTIWERWDSMLPDGTINPGKMTSFNHYALGAVCDWVYQVVGGIRPAAPGYAKVLVKPVPGEGITWARTRYDAPAGTVEVAWQLRDGAFKLTVELPAGLPATVVLPDGSSYEVAGGIHQFGVAL